MSLFGKTWKIQHIRKPEETLLEALSSARKITDPHTFFSDPTVDDLHDPFLFSDMQKAVDRIMKAIPDREKIIVYGDYDVDGTSGAALLVHTLRFLGAQVSYRVPNRLKDGYGLHIKYIDELAEKDAKILITVDCGIANIKEVKHAQSKDIDVIITDHHHIPLKEDGSPNPPEAFAILHPKLSPDYPFNDLSGSGVAFKLACALLIHTNNEEMIPTITDLASLGTVADCVPLHGENRALLKIGLKQMEQTQWDGLRAILENTGHWAPNSANNTGNKEITSETIGFQIGPRINAAGRIDNPLWAIQTLISSGEEARQKSFKLESLNAERKAVTIQALQEAEAALNLDDAIHIVAGPWSKGIVGLLAGRIQEKYQKPTLILQDEGTTMTGSARSMPGFHCVEAIKQADHILVGYGGHAQAAGFHLKAENFPAFKAILLAYAEELFKTQPIKPELKIDSMIEANELTLDSFHSIQKFAPFGIGNPQPAFLIEDFEVLNPRLVGQDKSHLSFQLKVKGSDQSQSPQIFKAIAFRWGEYFEAIQKAERMVVQLSINEWQGQESLQLFPLDFA